MRQFTLRLSVALLTFIMGVSVASVWLINRRPKLLNSNVQALNVSAAENSTTANDSNPPSNIDEAYAVYSAVLADERYSDKLMVISDHTFPSDPTDATYLKKEMPDLSQDMISDYQAKNKEQRSLHNTFDVGGKVIFITDKEEDCLFRKGNDGWSSFYKKYPHARGKISFSGVGFNRDRTEALLNVGIGCGWLCGEGNFILLHMENGRWSIQRKLMTWVS